MYNFLNKAITVCIQIVLLEWSKIYCKTTIFSKLAEIDPMAILAKNLTSAGDVTDVLLSTDQNKEYEKECREVMVDPTLPSVIVDKKV